MATLLDVLGILFLVLVVGVAVAILWIRHRVRTFFSSVADLLGGSASQSPGSRIKLTSATKVEWSEPDTIDEWTTELGSAGFAQVGDFSVDGVASTQLRAFVHESDRLYAVIYQQTGAGIWCDVATFLENDREITVTNHQMAGLMDRPPEAPLLLEVDWTPAKLAERLKSERGETAARPVSADQFCAEFEAAYAREMDWRNARGGPTLEEVRRVASHTMGDDVDEETIAFTFEIERAKHFEQVGRECIEEYARQQGVGDEDLEDLFDESFVVLSTMEFSSCAESWLDECGISDDDRESAEAAAQGFDGKALDHFEEWIAKLPSDSQPEFLAEVSEPVRARIYRTALEIA